MIARSAARRTIGTAAAAFALSAVATGAYLWSRNPPASPIPSSAVSARLVDPDAAPDATRRSSPDVLVWAGQAVPNPHEQDLDSVRTWWLTTDDHGTRVVGHTRGVLILHDGMVWRWKPTEKEIPPCMCDGTAVAGKGVSVGADLVGVGHAGNVTVVSPPDFCNADAPPASITLLGTVGPFLFVRTDHTEYGCGAHGISVPRFVVWSLASRQEQDLLRAVDVTRARQTALAQLGPSPPGEPSLTLADVDLVSLQPAFDSTGRLVVQAGFKTFACHACTGATSFTWGQYSRGVLAPVDVIPAPLRAFDPAPDAVAWFVARFADLVVGGWSAAGSGSAVPDSLRQEMEPGQPR